MVRSIEGVFRNGKVELLQPAPTDGDSRVIVTFLAGDGAVDLSDRGIDAERAADLRRRLAAFTDDWDRPEMDAYDAL